MKGVSVHTHARLAALTSVAAIALGAGEAKALLATSSVYSVYDVIGQGSVQGTITTDGAIGVLATADILGWSLKLTGAGGATYTLNGTNDGSPGNHGVGVQGGDLYATPSDLLFNYGGSDGGFFAFQQVGYTNSGYHYWCNNTSWYGCAGGQSVVPEAYFNSSAQYVPTKGVKTIALGDGVNYWPNLGTTTESVQVDNGAYTDQLTYSVSKDPPSATYSNGLFHYTYELGYVGQQTLVLPLFHAGNRSHPPAVQAAAFAGIMGSVRFARAAAMREQA